MRFKTNFKKGSHLVRSLYILLIRGFVLSALIFAGIQTPLQAQEVELTQPSWWFGTAAGINLNFYQGSTQQLNSDLTVPTAFHDGFGVGLFLAPHVEFHHPESRWGVILEAAYDSRRGSFEEVKTPCNCPADLTANLSYISFEPSLRFAPFKSDLYLFAGPRFAYNLSKSFTYKLGINPDYPDQEATPDVKGDFSDVEKFVISMQIGAGYDFHLSSKDNLSQFVLSPFVSFQPYYGQEPRSTETWNITTVRFGAVFKFGKAHKSSSQQPALKTSAPVAAFNPLIHFTVYAPENIPEERRVDEIFPIRNYVFFDLGSTEIPDRYVLINKRQVKDFKEDQLEVFKPKKLSGRSDREMIVYYNVMNILGDRMVRFPSSTITLVGSSKTSQEDGKAMARSIQQYLVDIFGIDASRIKVEARDKPKIPSEQPGGDLELKLLNQDDRRVSIESTSPELLMEYQTGQSIPLKPVKIVTTQKAPLDSYVVFTVDGAKKALSSWSLEIKDKNGVVQYFGPYTQEVVRIPGKTILGTKPEGDYRVTMIGKKDNRKVLRDTTLNMVLWTPTEKEMGMRFNVIFEFNESDVISLYEKYLTDIVIPQIPKNGTVIIHGYTDIIGDADHNKTLSLARANDVRGVIEKGLAKTQRKDVKFRVYGFGENEKEAPFDNNFPEERFYNRTVIIDIIPPK
ncbi:MAG TPA: flagellar motor protein MotB [Bacteroidales bacterium]|jgi:outer membrane protein OmpA-like peptidoglycan-associated protein|nr:flagellar motor protein MotB [Bacteroidales bacterium]